MTREKKPRRMLYLAHPIDLHDGIGQEVANSLLAVKGRFIKQGWIVYDPASANEMDQHEYSLDDRIWKVNYRALTMADAVVAFLPRGAQTVGTVMEIERMRNAVPVFVMTDIEGSWALQAPGFELLPLHNSPMITESLVRQEVDEWERAGLADRRAAMKFVMHEGAEYLVPMQAHVGDAGFDLSCWTGGALAEHWMVEPGEHIRLTTGVRQIELPSDYWGFIAARSSTRERYGVTVRPSVIDAGYRGELFIGVDNFGEDRAAIPNGARIAQLIPVRLASDSLRTEVVKEVSDHDRGTNGFGSSGR